VAVDALGEWFKGWDFRGGIQAAGLSSPQPLVTFFYLQFYLALTGNEETNMALACDQCGSPQAPGDAFCGNCGKPAAPSAGVTGDGDVGTGALVDLNSTVLTTTPGIDVTPSAPPAPWPGDVRNRTGQATTTSEVLARDVALGQATPNATYVGQRLLFDKVPEAPFDPLGNTAITRQIARRGLLYFLIYLVGGFLAGILCAPLIFVGGLGVVLWFIGAAVSGLVLLCLYWLLPVPALLSEWKFSVDGAALAAPRAFEHITWSLERRRTPLDQLQVRRLTLPGEGKRDYLELRKNIFVGYVACFPFGEDLYVGWTMWVHLSPARLLLMGIARIWHSLTGRGNDLFVTLRYDSIRAMREAMHSTAREGIDAAVGQVPAEGRGIIGTEVKVTEVSV
jgi:hypothetical protein